MTKILKWAGSKANVFHQFRHYLDFDRPYIEPFCGSAAFFFFGNPPIALLNDSNTKLINFYRRLRDTPRAVWEVYSSIPVTEEQYYLTRSQFNEEDDNIVTAAKFLYLNHYCFNGIYRTNKSGRFNTPYGAKTKAKQKIALEKLLEASSAVENADFHCDDFEAFLTKTNPVGATIYMDPPYHTSGTRVFKEYGASIFSDDDLKRLASCSLLLAKKNKIIISYKKCPEFLDAFGDFIVGEIDVTRNVGGFIGRRKIESEYIALMDDP